MTPGAERISILCVDDNEQMARALRVKLRLAGGFIWKGWLPGADELVQTVQHDEPNVVLLDIDMPGKNPFEAMSELVRECPQARAIIFSGHVRRELIDRAIESGAWAYVSKNDGEDELLATIRRVVSGEFVLSSEVRATYDHT